MNSDLIDGIKKAFSSVEYPGDMNLVQNIQYPESHELFESFKGKHWREINVDLAGHWRMNLSRFTDLGFHHYLPAFLLASLAENPFGGEDPFELEMFVVFNLEPPDDKSNMERFVKRMALFDKAQKSIIYKYLQYFASFADENESDYMREVLNFWKPDNE